MPTYDYYCKACDTQFEAVQRMSEPPLTECRQCGGTVQRLISPVGVIFKGSGFHVNDYRKPEAKKESESKSESKSKVETPASTPAATPAAPAK